MSRICNYACVLSILVLVGCGSDSVNIAPRSSDNVSEATYNGILTRISERENVSDPMTVLFKAREYFPADFKPTLEDEGIAVRIDEPTKRIQVAQMVTRKAQLEAIKNIREGMTENELKNVVLSSFKEDKASGEAFAGIVATGKNSTNIRYYSGDTALKSGDLVVVNIGALVDGYCGDIGRTYPVNGKFTDRQKEIYKLVLGALNYVIKNFKPGSTSLNDIDDLAIKYFKDSKLTAVTPDGRTLGIEHFMLRSIAHYTDKKIANLFRNIPIQEGKTITIGPGLYIESENIGVRIEDTYLVSNDKLIGYVFMPESVYDIEYLFQQR